MEGFDDEAQIRRHRAVFGAGGLEADNQSQMFTASPPRGEVISGFGDLPKWHGRFRPPPYAAFGGFYRRPSSATSVRVAALLQPVASAEGAMAVIQVAETLEVRETLALQILEDPCARPCWDRGDCLHRGAGGGSARRAPFAT